MYVGLSFSCLGLVISGLGLGGSGFTVLALQLFGPVLLIIGVLFLFFWALITNKLHKKTVSSYGNFEKKKHSIERNVMENYKVDDTDVEILSTCSNDINPFIDKKLKRPKPKKALRIQNKNDKAVL